MISGSGNKFRKTNATVVYMLYAITALIVCYMYTMRPGANYDVRHSVTSMIDGTAQKPFITRALMPIIVRTIDLFIPQHFTNAIDAKMETSAYKERFHSMFEMLGWDSRHVIPYLMVFILQTLCFFGFAVCMRYLTRSYYKTSAAVVNITPLVALLMLPIFFVYGLGYIYDPATLFFFSLGLLVLGLKEWWIFYVVLFFASLNRETAFLLIIYFVLLNRERLSKDVLIKHIGALTSLFVILQVGLRIYYRNSAGEGLAIHLYGTFVDNFVIGDPIGQTYIVAVFAIFTVPIVLYWKRTPIFLREALSITMLLLGIAWICVSRLVEMRTFFEAYPLITLMLVPAISNVLVEQSDIT